jgi:DNA-directed RNA polymerase subunit RPC12/RpoP
VPRQRAKIGTGAPNGGCHQEVAMPNWVLHCVNCRKEFVHSKIEDDGLLSIYPESKPNFSPGGDELKCPHCGRKAFYQRYQLTYRAQVLTIS